MSGVGVGSNRAGVVGNNMVVGSSGCKKLVVVPAGPRSA